MAFEIEYKIEHAVAGTVAHLAKSGLAIEDFPPGDIEPVTASQAAARGHAPVAGYLIKFRGPDGKLTDFERQRNLSGRGGKELQKAATGSHVYFPVIEGVDWQNLKPGSTIYICESVIKAIRTVKEGVIAIGINGVEAFRSKKTGQFDILDAIKALPWKGLNLTARILFDSNLRDNPMVKNACTTLAYELSALGAIVDVIKLPHTASGKQQGIDDYLQAGGKFSDLVAEKIPYIEVLGEFNEKYAVIRNPTGILDLEDNTLLSTDAWLKPIVYDRHMQVMKVDNKAKPPVEKPVTVKMGPEWLSWPNRRSYKGYKYEPGKPKDLADGFYNLCDGPDCECIPGDVSHAYELLNSIFDNDWAKIKRFVQWLAWPIAHPGAKLHTAWVIWGVPWSGKTLLGLAMERQYGKGWRKINNKQLHGRFNQWQKGAEFVLVEEALASDRREDTELMKDLVTQATYELEEKGVKQVTLAAHDNFLIVSNNKNPVFIDAADRRFEVHHVTRVIDHERSKEIAEELRSDEGAAAWRHHLAHEVDLSDFDPLGRSQDSADRTALERANWSSLDWECHYAVEAAKEDGKGKGPCPANLIRLDLLTKKIAITVGYSKPTAVANALEKQGARLVVRVTGLRTDENGDRERYNVWAVEHHDFWVKQPMAAIRSIVEKPAKKFEDEEPESATIKELRRQLLETQIELKAAKEVAADAIRGADGADNGGPSLN